MPSLSSVDLDESYLYTFVLETHHKLDVMYEHNDSLFYGRNVEIAAHLQLRSGQVHACVVETNPHTAFLVGKAW